MDFWKSGGVNRMDGWMDIACRISYDNQDFKRVVGFYLTIFTTLSISFHVGEHGMEAG